MERDWGREKDCGRESREKDHGEKPGDKAMEWSHGTRGGDVDRRIKEGKMVLLYGPDPREDVGKIWTTGVGNAVLVDAVEAYELEGDRMVNDDDELGWWTSWNVVEKSEG